MARSREIKVIETITCDVCGRAVDKATTQVIGFGGKRWEVDVCAKDRAALESQFKQWTSKARVLTGRRRTARQAQDEWEFLESLGFTRHRGRKSAEEAAALAKR